MRLSLHYFSFVSFLLLSAILFSASKYLPCHDFSCQPNDFLPPNTTSFALPDGGNTCAEALFLCDGLDGLTGTLDSFNIQQIFPGCPANTLNNPDWYAFVAGSTCISMVVTPSNCQSFFGQVGLQAAIYAQCSDTGKIPMTVQCECTESAFTLASSNFVVGQVYYIVFDGCAGDICDYAVDVTEGNTAGLLAVLGPDTLLCAGETATYSIGAGQSDIAWLPIEHAVFDTLDNAYTISVSWDSAFIGHSEVCAIVSGSCLPDYTVCLQVSVGEVVQPLIQGETILCAGDSASYSVSAMTCQYTDLFWEANNGSLLTNQGQTDMTVLWSDTASTGKLCVKLVTTTGDTISECVNVALHYCQPCDSLVAKAGFYEITCYDTALPEYTIGTTNALGDSLAFQWTYNGAIVSTSDTVFFQNIGSYIFTVTDLRTGCSSSDVFEFIDNTEPPIADAGPDMILGCYNNSVTLDGSNSSLGSSYIYQWTNTSGNIYYGLTPTVTQFGYYTLQVLDINNGCYADDVVNVLIEEFMPIVPILTTPDSCQANTGTATLLIPPDLPPFSILWSTGETTATITNLAAGEYVAILTFGFCSYNGTATVGTVGCTATNETEADLSLQLLPNPNDGHFAVQLELPKSVQLQLDLLDVLGQVVTVVQPNSVLAQGKHVFEVDADLPGGVYLLRVKSGEQSRVVKMVVR